MKKECACVCVCVCVCVQTRVNIHLRIHHTSTAHIQAQALKHTSGNIFSSNFYLTFTSTFSSFAGFTETAIDDLDSPSSELSAEILIIEQTVLPVNDLPIIDLNGAPSPGLNYATTFTEDSGAAVLLSESLAILDPDHPNMVNASVCGVLPDAGEGIILMSSHASITIVPNVVGQDGRTCFHVLGTAPRMVYEEVLGLARYINPVDEPSGSYRTITFHVHDGEHSGYSATNVTINFVNDKPDLYVNSQMGTETNLSFTENNSPIYILPNAVVSDSDSLVFNGFNITMTGVRDGLLEALIVTHPAAVGTLPTNSGSETVLRHTFATPVNQSTLEAVLRSITYINAEPEPLVGVRMIRTSIADDMDAASEMVLTRVTVNAVNDNAPMFSQAQYMACVPEGVRGHCVDVNIVATDADSTNQPETTVTYGLLCRNQSVSLGSGSASGGHVEFDRTPGRQCTSSHWRRCGHQRDLRHLFAGPKHS